MHTSGNFFLFFVIIPIILCPSLHEICAQEPLSAFSLGGSIEIEASYSDIDPNLNTSILDMSLATVELTFTRSMGRYTSVHLAFLKEDDSVNKNFLVDEAAVTIVDPFFYLPLYFTIGKTYLPFGKFTSSFISDPYTKRIGEIKEAGGVMVYSYGRINLGLSAFKENELDLIESEERIADYIININIERSDFSPFAFGLSYLSHISDTNGLQHYFKDKTLWNHIGGINIYIKAEQGPFSFNFEFVGALDFINYTDHTTLMMTQIEPYALNSELGFLGLADRFLSAIKFEHCKYAKDLLLIKEYRYGAILSYALFEKTFLCLEYLYEKRSFTDSLVDDDHITHKVTAQLSLTF